jgi:hypothetical protein
MDDVRCPVHGRYVRVAEDGTLLSRCSVCLVEAQGGIDLQVDAVAAATAWAEYVLARIYGPDWRAMIEESRRRRLRAVS